MEHNLYHNTQLREIWELAETVPNSNLSLNYIKPGIKCMILQETGLIMHITLVAINTLDNLILYINILGQSQIKMH